MKRSTLLILVLTAALTISAVINLWLYIGWYYSTKLYRELLTEIRARYVEAGSQLSPDVERRLNTSAANGFQDREEMLKLLNALRKSGINAQTHK